MTALMHNAVAGFGTGKACRCRNLDGTKFQKPGAHQSLAAFLCTLFGRGSLHYVRRARRDL
jgi:hypothetical protein